jgi:hypothetical protein
MGLFAVWLALFAAGFLAYAVTEATGDSFTRGLNRIGNFLGFEAAAALAAVMSWVAMRRCRDRDRAILITGYTPPIVSGLLWGVIVSFMLFAIATAQFGG